MVVGFFLFFYYVYFFVLLFLLLLLLRLLLLLLILLLLSPLPTVYFSCFYFSLFFSSFLNPFTPPHPLPPRIFRSKSSAVRTTARWCRRHRSLTLVSVVSAALGFPFSTLKPASPKKAASFTRRNGSGKRAAFPACFSREFWRWMKAYCIETYGGRTQIA